MPVQLNYIDLFAGIGGFRLALDSLGLNCVLTSEIDRNSQRTYGENFPNSLIYGDITRLRETIIPPHDLLVAGFPCQPFSSLGQHEGLRDAKSGNLFWEILRIAEHCRPDVLLLENVQGLVSMQRGQTLRLILSELRRIDYKVSYQVLDSYPFVPQHRNRVFILAVEKEIEHNRYMNLDSLVYPRIMPTLSDILRPQDDEDENLFMSDVAMEGLHRYRTNNKLKGNAFDYGVYEGHDIAPTLPAHYSKRGQEILIPVRDRFRKLSVRECARLMGYPDDFSFPVAQTHAYKQLGNSVVPPLIRAIASYILSNVQFSSYNDKLNLTSPENNTQLLMDF